MISTDALLCNVKVRPVYSLSRAKFSHIIKIQWERSQILTDNQFA